MTYHNISLAAAFILLSALFTTSANAQTKSLVDIQNDSLKASHKIITFGGSDNAPAQAHTDSVRTLIESFYYDQFRHFSDPAAPYFLFMSKDANLAMGVGGAVRMRGYFDWGGAIPAAGFAPALIPMTPVPTQMRHFDTTPAGSCLFFRVLGRNSFVNHYQLYIEANFNGWQARDFHLKKAYAIINDFTIGYATSTFSDPAAIPPTVDAQGPNNKISNTNVLVRWMPRVKQHWVFAVSAETPATKINTDNVTTSKIDNWIPDLAIFAQYEWGPTSHIRLSGIVRALSYRDIPAATNHYLAGWGLLLSGVGHPIPQLTTYGTISYGHGYAGLGGDLMTGNYDLVPDNPGHLYAPALLGWNIGVQYNILPNLFVSTSLSLNRYLPSHSPSPDEYRYGMASDVNIFWNMTPRIQVGAEFDYGIRKNFDGQSRSARRIGAMAQFSF
ncbi:MAG: hypothetical protein K2M94_02330 [Paramuribaculum sp.]|nr:hypothetical protein [Paramuribaculum sp.]